MFWCFDKSVFAFRAVSLFVSARHYSRLCCLMSERFELFIPPISPVDKPFLLSVEQVVSIPGKGTVATGKIEAGQVKTGEKVELSGGSDQKKLIEVMGLEMFHKTLDVAMAGDQCGKLFHKTLDFAIAGDQCGIGTYSCGRGSCRVRIWWSHSRSSALNCVRLASPSLGCLSPFEPSVDARNQCVCAGDCVRFCCVHSVCMRECVVTSYAAPSFP